jgi:hypothetical protein
MKTLLPRGRQSGRCRAAESQGFPAALAPALHFFFCRKTRASQKGLIRTSGPAYPPFTLEERAGTIMNARHTLFATLALCGLAHSAFAQDWTSEATYTKTVTTTTVTTITPSYPAGTYVQPWNNTPEAAPAPQPQPTIVQANYMQPAYTASAYNDAINLQANYPQPTYAQPNYVQPTYVSYGQPAAMPVNYAPATYVQPAYVRPMVYPRPAYVAQPVVATYYRPVYRPVVAAYGPTYMPAPATCEVPVAQPAVAVPAGPKVWVHEKVYVQGQPLRNLLTAITP